MIRVFKGENRIAAKAPPKPSMARLTLELGKGEARRIFGEEYVATQFFIPGLYGISMYRDYSGFCNSNSRLFEIANADTAFIPGAIRTILYLGDGPVSFREFVEAVAEFDGQCAPESPTSWSAQFPDRAAECTIRLESGTEQRAQPSWYWTREEQYPVFKDLISRSIVSVKK